MASLSSVKLNSTAIRGGEWVTVHPAEDQSFDIHTRGFTPEYKDELAKLRVDEARRLNKGMEPGQWMFSPEALPPSVDDPLQGKALAAQCVLGVRDLTHADGSPVTLDEFTALLCDPVAGQVAIRLAIQAAGTVSQIRDETTKAAVGN